MSSSMLNEVRRHCSTVPDFCIRTIVDEMSGCFTKLADESDYADLIDIKSAHVLMAANFLVQDEIFAPDMVYCFIPFLTRQIYGMDIGNVLGPTNGPKPVFIFVEDRMLSIRQGFIPSGPAGSDTIVRRDLNGIVPKDEKIDPIRTIAFNISKAVMFCCTNPPPQQGPIHGSPRSPGKA